MESDLRVARVHLVRELAVHAPLFAGRNARAVMWADLKDDLRLSTHGADRKIRRQYRQRLRRTDVEGEVEIIAAGDDEVAALPDRDEIDVSTLNGLRGVDDGSTDRGSDRISAG